MKSQIKTKFKQLYTRYKYGIAYMTDPLVVETSALDRLERTKLPLRSVVINELLASLKKPQTTYLEIGVRNPLHNFDKIIATEKISVDPGVEFKSNPVKFKLTSDEFFKQLREGKLLKPDLKFDVIFIDGLHLAEQVWRDINNALAHVAADGFVVLHDCNPPSQWHARETYKCDLTPAGESWNGTTWKAYLKARYLPDVQSCCVDTDWGVGVLCKHLPLGQPRIQGNPFYEFQVLADDREAYLNLIKYEQLQLMINKTGAGAAASV